MIVGAGVPGATGVGEQFLAGMLSDYPEKLVQRFAISNQASGDSVSWRGSTCHTRKVVNSKLPGLATMADRNFRRKQLPALTKSLIEITQQQGTDVVWAFLNSIPMFHLMDSFRKESKIPLAVSSWDSPEYLIFKSRLNRSGSQKALQKFSNVVQASDQVITICPQMSEIYKSQFGIASIPMPFCPPKSDWLDVRTEQIKAGPLKVIFAGSLYATNEWNYFLTAIEKHNASDSGRPIEVTCLGLQSRKAKHANWVKYEPAKPPAEAARMINKSDLAYLPYWMDEKYAHFTRTAFPSKLPFYVASGTPVFFHGPVDSTPAELIRKYPVGTNCHSLESSSIIDSLMEASSDSARKEFVLARQQVFQEDLDPQRGGQIFAATIKKISSR